MKKCLVAFKLTLQVIRWNVEHKLPSMCHALMSPGVPKCVLLTDSEVLLENVLVRCGLVGWVLDECIMKRY